MAKHPKPKPTTPSDLGAIIADAINKNQSGSTSKGAAPIGVPKGFTRTQPGNVPAAPGINPLTLKRQSNIPGVTQQMVTSGPSYFKGDEWKIPGSLGQQDLVALQQFLIQAGLAPKGSVIGQWDQGWASAFSKVLGSANVTGSTWQDALTSRLSAQDQGNAIDSSGSKLQPFQAQLTDPITLKSAFRQTANQIYGGDLPDEEINQMVDAYRAIQLQKEQANYDTNITGGTIDTLESPGDFAEQQIRDKHPDQVAKMEFNGTLSGALKSITQAGGGLM